MEISDGVIRLGLRPRRITPSSISIILHKTQPHSLIVKYVARAQKTLGGICPRRKTMPILKLGRSIVGLYVYVFIRQVSLTQPSSF